MAREQAVTIGSGTLPHAGPLLPSISGQFPEGTYPVPGSRADLRTIIGSNVVVINPEDFSVHVGLRQQAIAVGASALPLPITPLEYRRALVVHNDGPGTLYIGDSTVTVANGFPIAANEKISVMIQGHDGMTVYGIADTTADVRVLELA